MQVSIKMAKNIVNFPFSGGLNRSILPLRADPGTFYDLLNFRHSATQFGLLEQTPYFVKSTVSRGTYWTSGGGSQTEPTDAMVKMMTQSHWASDYVLRSVNTLGAVGSQLQVYYQTTVPAATGLTKGCMLDCTFGAAALGLAIGETFDVEIDGATTFQWRLNGGAWTSLVPIALSVTLGAGVYLYFLTTTGFTVGDRWTWTRTDYTSGPTTITQTSRPFPFVYHQDKLYFINEDNRVMVAFGDHAISLGYRPIFGSELASFDDHLIIGNYSTTALARQNKTCAGVVGWSDKTDLGTFYATDVNEADQKKLPNDVRGQLLDTNWANTTSPYVVGFTVQNDRLFVVTTSEIYYTDALGLPIVFSFKKLVDNVPDTLAVTTLIHAQGGVYILDNNKTYFFDGNSFNIIAMPLGDFVPTFGSYNLKTKELLLVDVTNHRLLCYQESYKTWYSRSISFDKTVSCIRADNNTNIWLGTNDLGFVAEQTVSAQPSYDSATGTAYTTPKITTQCLGQDLYRVKEVSSLYIGFFVDSASSSTYYSTGANIQCKLHWYNSLDGRITGTPSTHASAVRVSTDPDGLVSFPRVPYRTIAFELQVNGLVSGKPPMQISVTALEPAIRDERQIVER